jgi:GTP diphosphokinase / guanosine-3',5'-bis(diphosphate) 3'-diphosphatase
VEEEKVKFMMILPSKSGKIMSLKQLLSLKEQSFDEEQVELISKAYYFSKKAHTGQKRISGGDYFYHSVATAATLVKMGLGSLTTSAALLHDVPEDTDVTLEEIEKEFGEDVAFIVKGVTKLSKIKLRDNVEDYYLENLRKMFLAMAADIRVVLIKIADRFHNMKTLDAMTREKQIRIARETKEIFVPIANRLGLGEIKGQMEDLTFKYLDKENYEKIVKLEEEAFGKRKGYVEKAIKELRQELKKSEIKVIDIHGRAKHYYSLFRKLQRYDMDINKIYDLVAIRIVVPTVADCYEALGIVHNKFRPLIGRIKDYNSLPKPNGYRSIHTTVFGPDGKILEVQIRTQRMHDEAEFGIAAHWIYSEKRGWKDFIFNRKNNLPQNLDKEIEWVKQLRAWHQETGGKSDEFWASLKIDFFKDQIFAFTPRGDVIELPENATPVDFAYQIHSEIGDRLTSAKVNGKMVSLSYNIKNGDLIDVQTSKNKKLPNRDWLKFVKTAHARSRIRSSLKKNGIELNNG